MTTIATWNAERAAEIVALRIGRTGGTAAAAILLPVLHDLQAEFGHIPDDAIPLVAHALNLSRADVHGVATFYHDFRRTPPGRHVVKLCRAEACQAMGGERLAENLRARLKIDWGETTADGNVTLEPVFCLGLCACAPAALIDGKVAGRLDEHKLDAALAKVKP
ncbi:MAG: formate dehydrogenase subunit gamma [Rhodobacteraceae bacterium]|nr:formate dehydrogenase subunit gamma [Paracoccaceae bacterium]